MTLKHPRRYRLTQKDKEVRYVRAVLHTKPPEACINLVKQREGKVIHGRKIYKYLRDEIEHGDLISVYEYIKTEWDESK